METKLRAYWTEHYTPRKEGLNRELGCFWLSYICGDEEKGTISISVTVPRVTKPERRNYWGCFVSLRVCWDGVDTIRDLEACGFMQRFKDLHACTFYDVFQCLHLSGIPLVVHGNDKTLIADRKMYELLTKEPVVEEPKPVCYMGHEDCYDDHAAERRADEADWEADRERDFGPR